MLKDTITDDMKTAMRAGNKKRLSIIRMILAEVKQREVDERIILSDEQLQTILTKMLKQRKESIKQFEAAGRDDLVQQESFEAEVIISYMPEPLDANTIEKIINEALQTTGAESIKDMGKVMQHIKPLLQGRADMGQVSKQIKAQLSA